MNLAYDTVRSLLIECLRASNQRPFDSAMPPYRIETLCREMASKARERDLRTLDGHNAWTTIRSGGANLHPAIEIMARDVIWDLILEGILRPGADQREMELPGIHLTELGRKAVTGDCSPYDAGGYVIEITNKIPDVDPIIIQYVAESSEALRRNCLLSSTITLGCASEKAFLLMVDAFGEALDAHSRSNFITSMAKLRSIKQQHTEFEKWYDRKLKSTLKASKGGDWVSEFEDCLHLLFNYFRAIRNDAGHPTGTKFTREKVHSNLVIFPNYLRLIYDLIDWMKSNTPLS